MDRNPFVGIVTSHLENTANQSVQSVVVIQELATFGLVSHIVVQNWTEGPVSHWRGKKQTNKQQNCGKRALMSTTGK